jgi:hypothetical protein
MIRRALISCAVALLSSAALTASAAVAPAPMVYAYPPPEGGEDRRLAYYWGLLKSALEVTAPKWGAYVLAPSPVQMNSDRSQVLLADSKTITLLVRTTSNDRETLLRPVFIPLDKGLTGYRLFLIQKPTQNKLNAVRTLEDLKAFSIGQGQSWVDTIILRHAGLTVEAGAGHPSLFKMLQAGRFDVFSRGINEIGKEFQIGKEANSELAIERHLMLYYPLPRYYFFARTPEGERLARRVEEGLHLLIENGQFDKQYKAFKRLVLADLQLSGRRMFKITNPTLSPQTPLSHSEYWDTLADELKAPR